MKLYEGRLRIGLILLALLNMLPAVEAEESWGVFAIAILAGFLSTLPARADGRRMPLAVIYVCVCLAVAYLIYEMFGPHPGGTVYVLDLAHFMIFLCACKFLEMRTNRDMGLIAIIAFLVLVIGAFVSGSLLFAVAAAVDVTMGVWWMLLFHVKRERDAVAQRQARVLAGAPHSQHREGLAGRAAASSQMESPMRSPALYRPTVSLALGMLATTAALFVAVPRGWGRSMLGGIQRALPTNVTGYSEEVALSDTPLLENDAPVMRARFTCEGRLIGGADFEPYMRGATFDLYLREERSRWSRTPPGDVTTGNETTGRKRAEKEPGSKQVPLDLTELRRRFRSSEIVQQEVWLERAEGNALFALYPPLAFGSETIERFLHNTRDRTLQIPNPGHGPLNYLVESPHQIDARRARLLAAEDRVSKIASQSAIPRAVREAARQIASTVGDPADPALHEAIANAIRSYLSGRDFTYSLDPGGQRPSNVDPIEHFLKNRRGHCEYFASAMTLMCQSLGIRARLVSGYYGGEYNPVGGFYQFRARDAHAWVEVRLPEKGWVAFDPSPSAGARRGGVSLHLWAEIRRFADFLQFEWSTFVVAFDSDHRQELVAGFANWLDSLQSEGHGPALLWRATKMFLWGPSFLSKGQRALYWSFLALCMAFAILLLRILWILLLMASEYLPLRRRQGPRVIRRAEARFYDRIAVLLAHKGHARPDYLTPREFALRLSTRYGDLADLPHITDWFYAAQFGETRLDAQRRERIREFSRRLREEPSFGTRSRR